MLLVAEMMCEFAVEGTFDQRLGELLQESV
jgi:hypothetical protein